jgi:hypothetical protein
MFAKTRVPIAALVSAAVMGVPANALAAGHPGPGGRHTIALVTSENPVTYGDQLVLFGRLRGSAVADRRVVLWHRIDGSSPVFTPIQSTTTDPTGFYDFQRLADVVKSNRDYYVTSLGARSRTLREKVVDVVTLSGPSADTPLITGRPASTFTGTVTPGDAGDVVLLQRQSATGPGLSWGTIQTSRVGAGGAFSLDHVFIVPGDANIRVLVRATPRHLASASPSLTYDISQAQNPALTASASADPIPYGAGVTISGALAAGAGQTVTLYGHQVYGSFAPIAEVTTGTGGTYSFPVQTPLHSMFYDVRVAAAAPVTSTTTTTTPTTSTTTTSTTTMSSTPSTTSSSTTSTSSPTTTTSNTTTSAAAARRYPGRRDVTSSSVIFVGVKDVLTASASATTVSQGGTVTFSGSVAPDVTGHVIWLQQENVAGTGFHTVQVVPVLTGSTFTIVHQIFEVGDHVFRVEIPGGPLNGGANSQTFPVAVTAVSAAQLPQQQPAPQSQGQ